MVNGAVAGLVTITPACGYVNTTGAFFIGIIGGVVCYFGSQLKHVIRVDDALDAFGVHAIGGITGGILTAFFADKKVNGYNGIFYTSSNDGINQLYQQFYSIIVVSIWAALISYIILYILNYTMGLRVPVQIELDGLDKKFFREEINFINQFVEELEFATFSPLTELSHPNKESTTTSISTTASSNSSSSSSSILSSFSSLFLSSASTARTVTLQQITTHYVTTNILHGSNLDINEIENKNEIYNYCEENCNNCDGNYNDNDDDIEELFMEEKEEVIEEETKFFDDLL